jgi:DNA gyrase/topoisomerase IV subunit B
MAKEYNAKSVRVLDFPDNVRIKYGMYIGNNDDNGIRQIWGEAVANSLDEAAGGHNDKIYMGFEKDCFIIADSGRGIPVETHPDTKISTLTTVMTKLHAGAKIQSGKNNTYETSVGTFGVGISVTNALSNYLEVYTYRKGWYYQRFERGIIKTAVKKLEKPPVYHFKNKGTVIVFSPDYSIFQKNARFPRKEALEWVNTAAYFYPKVEFIISRDGNTKSIWHKKGVEALCQHQLEKQQAQAISPIFTYSDKNVSVALQWTDSSEDSLTSYVSGFKTSSGTHLTAFNKLLKAVFDRHKLKKQEFTTENLKVGLVGVLNITIPSPAFAGQTKEKLMSPEGAQAIEQISREFEKWALKNKNAIKVIIGRSCEISALESEFRAKKALATKTRVTAKGKVLLPPNFLAAKAKNPRDIELFLVEGESAKGSARDARDANIHAILPLKGKIVNAINASDDKLAANKQVIDIIKAIGYNPSIKDPYSKLKIGRLIFLSDADPDGYHISLLYSSVIFKLLRPLFAKKMVYYIRLPLFTCIYKDKRYFGDSLAELAKKVPTDKPLTGVTRMKGLGEVDPDVLNTIAFNPKTRKLVQIQWKDKAVHRYVSTLKTENTYRKSILGVENPSSEAA